MPDSPSLSASIPPRPIVAGKYFARGGRHWMMHGLTYGPFRGEDGLPSREQTARDLDMIAAWGANTVRLFLPPPDWFLDLCGLRGLSVAAGVGWTDHIDFLSSPKTQKAALKAVRETAQRLARRPEAIVLFVGNELQAPLVRWMGAARVQRFLEELIDAARDAAPDLLVAYANYPSTEYLQPANADFTAFNVYLENEEDFDRYTARLQNIAGDAPLVISEFGADFLRLGAMQQAAILEWQRRICMERGVAGNLIFSFTDEWHRGGRDVTEWEFGLTTLLRKPRPAWTLLEGGPPDAHELIPADPPTVSIIVCTRNGSHTLAECLASIARLDYPSLEAIVVDDGSTEDIASIVKQFQFVRYIRQEAQGLAVARNTGAAAARSSILAYTDDDCVVDPTWLIHLLRAFEDPQVAAAGGPNIPPAPMNLSQACVIAAPGGPAHVLLTDTTAEHIPGCNMAVRKHVFDEVNGFRPKYHAAGDDVDFCWRLMEQGHTIAFTAAAMVWHYRRFTVRAFFRQQAGYGKAEALLTTRHSSRFGQLGGARWRGAVYQKALKHLSHHASRIYSGVFGSAGYQAIYGAPASELGWLLTGFSWWLLVSAMALNALWLPPLGWVALALAALPLVYTLRQALRLPLARRWRGTRSRLLLWWLLLAQPVVRGWTRFVWNRRLGAIPAGPWMNRNSDQKPRLWYYKRVAALELWSEDGQDRHALLEALAAHLQSEGVPVRSDDGWRDWDMESAIGRIWQVRFSTVTEYHGSGRALTRVRISTRARFRLALAFGVASAAGIALVFLAQWNPVWVLGILFLLALTFESLHYRAVSKAATAIVAASGPAGFTQVMGEA